MYKGVQHKCIKVHHKCIKMQHKGMQHDEHNKVQFEDVAQGGAAR